MEYIKWRKEWHSLKPVNIHFEERPVFVTVLVLGLPKYALINEESVGAGETASWRLTGSGVVLSFWASQTLNFSMPQCLQFPMTTTIIATMAGPWHVMGTNRKITVKSFEDHRFFFFISVLEIKPRALHMWGQWSSTELHPALDHRFISLTETSIPTSPFVSV